MLYTIAIDFESFGKCPKEHGFTRLGAVLMRNSDSKQIATFDEFANQDKFKTEPRCMQQFWSKYPELLNATILGCETAAKDPWGVLDLFTYWVSSIMNIFEIDPNQIQLISDVVAFDVGLLSSFMTEDHPLYLFNTFKEIIDTSSYYLGMSMKPVNSALMNESSFDLALNALNKQSRILGRELVVVPKFTSADHTPLSDAINIAEKWCFVQRTIAELQE
jgi:hypothetical protein